MLLIKNEKLRKLQIKFHLYKKKQKSKNKNFIKNINKYLFSIDWSLNYNTDTPARKKQKHSLLKILLSIILLYVFINFFRAYIDIFFFENSIFLDVEIDYVVSLIIKCLNINDDLANIRIDNDLKISLIMNLIKNIVKNI